MRVLYVTTRQWNPGDEFILRGVRRILDEVAPDRPVEMIFNKSPQTTGLFEARNFWIRERPGRLATSLDFAIRVAHYDNSLKRHHDLASYDAVIFAGSPGWFGSRLSTLYRRLIGYQGKVIFLGIGTPNRPVRLRQAEREVMRRSTVVCRDKPLTEELGGSGISARFLPCPALLASPFEVAPAAGEAPIGLVFGSDSGVRYQRISPQAKALQDRLFRSIVREAPAEIVCHYSDELPQAIAEYPNVKVRYSFDAADYVSIFARYSSVISTRVHGCGIASSLAVPNAAIVHDRRGETVRGFRSFQVGGESEALEWVGKVASNAESMRSELQSHKLQTLSSYVAMLTDVLGA